MPYSRNGEVLWRSTSIGPVLLAPSVAHPELLGGIAAVVWEILDQPCSRAQIAEAAAAAVDLDAAVDEAIAALLEVGLLHEVT